MVCNAPTVSLSSPSSPSSCFSSHVPPWYVRSFQFWSCVRKQWCRRCPRRQSGGGDDCSGSGEWRLCVHSNSTRASHVTRHSPRRNNCVLVTLVPPLPPASPLWPIHPEAPDCGAHRLVPAHPAQASLVPTAGAPPSLPALRDPRAARIYHWRPLVTPHSPCLCRPARALVAACGLSVLMRVVASERQLEQYLVVNGRVPRWHACSFTPST